VEQELTEALSNFDLFALAVVGQGVGNDHRVVFIDDVILGVGGGEDDGSTHGYLGTEEVGGSYVLVVDQGFVESVENCIHDDLAGDVVSFSVGGGFSRGRGRKMARDLALGLGVHGRDKLGCGGLPSLGFLLQVLPSFNVGGVCDVFGWWVCSVGGCDWVVGVLAASRYVRVLVPLLVRGLLALYLFSVAPFPFPFLSFFGLGLMLLGPPVSLAVVAGPCMAERSCCIWVTRVPGMAIWLVRLFVAI